MEALKIGIVEDEGLIAESIMLLLQSLGYDALEPASDYQEAIKLIEKHKPDLMILDINLGESVRDGIELASFIKTTYEVPFIFLTANADKATVERAKATEPAAYLIKPFTRANLFATIEVAIAKQSAHPSYAAMPCLFLKDGSTYHKIFESDVLYVESDHVYLNVFTSKRKFLLRSTMDAFYQQLNPERFMKISRSFIINLREINSFSADHVVIQNKTLPISKSHRKDFLERMKIG
ncbi:MAG: response regulator [Chitinophagaceae bacterium]|nr:response regulator [Chitinophagaceae bacterium]